ncbi:Uncharacterised protein [Helicobacter fennelliae]|uniref:Uncharacterized protein n=1 Tax=Helicobacter fennelliae TaxID=215 RepID=A0A2X3BAU3_9HELI|nr:Uncharacterised protein [Helicobacter fennelliae]STP07783.1 Uncharacterised protein [Helicobacter fennelliae]STQ83872.1 Uncharacterised protein [Helicobacter fennelliae]
MVDLLKQGIKILFKFIDSRLWLNPKTNTLCNTQNPK